MSSADFLDAAEAIGRRVIADAIWHDGRCSWVGVSMDPKEAWHAEYHALAPNLYDGTAGIGLFLSELSAVTGDPAVRRTALGALRQAAVRAPAHRREGFHAGSLGIAWAAARAAEVLEEELDASARALTASAAPVPDGHLDVVLGSAGSTIARLALSRMLNDAALVDEAVAAGEALLAHATITRHGWSWASPEQPRRRHLCGLSHGAGGIGWALLELFATTGDDRFRVGAEGAFAYERAWATTNSGAWPDPRIGGHRRGSERRSPSPIAGSWCHGEAGIALTRLRAAQVLGNDPYEAEAIGALAATRRELAAAIPYDLEDATICHGATGSADVLLTAGDYATAANLGLAALERYGASGHWPCGLLGGITPGLYRGLTGIGWFYLRLHNPEIPSPLTVPLRLTATVAGA
jgi:lantibiotic modifying enzyme